MILSSHAIVGAAIAATFPGHPYLSFVMAFGSHFLLDAIPHKDYKILSLDKTIGPLDNSVRVDRKLFLDLLRTGTDLLVGIILSIFLFRMGTVVSTAYVIIPGIIGAVLPDFLQLLYWRFKGPLVYLQRFHLSVGADTDSRKGIITQFVTVIGVYLLFRLL